jgi:hypothetical protein
VIRTSSLFGDLTAVEVFGAAILRDTNIEQLRPLPQRAAKHRKLASLLRSSTNVQTRRVMYDKQFDIAIAISRKMTSATGRSTVRVAHITEGIASGPTVNPTSMPGSCVIPEFVWRR